MTTNQSLLCSKENAPEFIRHEYIYNGYRTNTNNQWECIKTMFILSNETINIWTHFLGAILFVFLTFSINDFLKGLHLAGFEDHIIVTVCCLCFLCCLLFSVFYHVFNCQSKEQFDYCFRLDLAGISISLCGIYFSSFYYAFYCYSFWKNFYTGTTFILIIVNISLQVLPRRIHSAKKDKQRIFLFVFMVLFGIVPACHWIYLHNGFSHPFVQEFLPQIIILYLITASAFFFYITKIPERFFPGYCDYIGHSHQWWHLLILTAFIWWYACSLKLLKYIYSNKNKCLVSP